MGNMPGGRANLPPKSSTTGQKRKADEISLNNFLPGGLFQAVDKNNAREELPTLDAKNKKEAIQKIRKLVPNGSKKDLGKLSRALSGFTGTGSCSSDGAGKWIVKGMTSSLDPYQVIGTSMMRQRETQLESPRGGLLAYQMGLGKTVMMLGRLLSNSVPNRS